MFQPEKFCNESISLLRSQIKGKAIMATSGGVDSTVAAILVSKAIGDRLLAVFVDTGMIRKYEAETVRDIFSKQKLNFIFIDAKKKFLNALKGVRDPEQKRKIIGKTFIDVFEDIAKKVKAQYLIQGTIAPDWIESGGGLRDTIKSHHNVGGLPKNIKLILVEPLRDLYKDEVRKLARHLKIAISEKQPFPGPGLGVRILGEITEEKVKITQEANHIIEEEVQKAVKEKKMKMPWQYFGVLLPLRSVGVHGDVRSYGFTIAIRAVESIDGMSAKYSKIPHDVLETISVRITNELKDSITRVVYDISNKPPATIEWE